MLNLIGSAKPTQSSFWPLFSTTICTVTLISSKRPLSRKQDAGSRCLAESEEYCERCRFCNDREDTIHTLGPFQSTKNASREGNGKQEIYGF